MVTLYISTAYLFFDYFCEIANQLPILENLNLNCATDLLIHRNTTNIKKYQGYISYFFIIVKNKIINEIVN